jgi:hypothetical protein
MKIGIIRRGRHGELSAREISKEFEITVFEIPEELPEILEDVEIPEDILGSDLIISYAAHPDFNIALVKKAKGVVFITGKGGSRKQLKELAKKYGREIVFADICCNAPVIDNSFFRLYGKPSFEVDVEGGRLKRVRVVRSAFCGASHFVAEMLEGTEIEDAPSKAGYYTQIYPCLASRGINGKIHLAAKIHQKAIERAIKRAVD